MATNLTQYFPFATGPGSNVSETQWREMARQWLGDGVVIGEGAELETTEAGPPAMIVTVGAGQVRIRGHVGIQDAAVDLPVTGNGSGSTRIDLLVARADFVNDRVEFDVVAGVPGAGVAPAPVQTAAVWELPLYEVEVADGALSILDADLADVRTLIADPAFSPTGPVDGDTWVYNATSGLWEPGAVPGWSFVGARVRHTIGQSCPGSSTRTTLAFDTEVFDVGGIHSASPNSDLTVPAGLPGKWRVYFALAIQDHGGTPVGQRYVYIDVNGVGTIEFPYLPILVSNSVNPVGASVDLDLAVGDDVSLAVLNPDSGAITVLGSNGAAGNPVFGMTYLGEDAP